MLMPAMLCALGGCAISVPEEQAERETSRRAGVEFEAAYEDRRLPDLPQEATLEDVLYYAFRSNAEIERAYFEWSIALERVPQSTALDDPSLSFEYLFSRDQMQRWDRTTLGAAQMLPAPGTRRLAGEIALHDAVAARRRFEDAKFSLQARVVTAWQQLLLIDQSIAIAERNLELFGDIRDVVLLRVAVGQEPQVSASKIDLEIEAAENELASERAARRANLAELNALLSRPAALAMRPIRRELPEVARTDAEILDLVAQQNPQLQALAAQVRGREDALALAQKAYVPDLEIGFRLVGTMEQMIMGMLRVPVQAARIEAGIREAKAGISMARAALRSYGDDLRALTALQLYLMRDASRQAAFFRESLIPRAIEVVQATEAGYVTGTVSFLELLDSQRSLLAMELALAQAESVQATAVAELEALAGMDFGTLTEG